MPKDNFTETLIRNFLFTLNKKEKRKGSVIVNQRVIFVSAASDLLNKYSNFARFQKELVYLSFLRKSKYNTATTTCVLFEPFMSENNFTPTKKIIILSYLLKPLSNKVLYSICLEEHGNKELKDLTDFFNNARQNIENNSEADLKKLMADKSNVSDITLSFRIAAYNQLKQRNKNFNLQNANKSFGTPISLSHQNLLHNLFSGNNLVNDIAKYKILPFLDTRTLFYIFVSGHRLPLAELEKRANNHIDILNKKPENKKNYQGFSSLWSLKAWAYQELMKIKIERKLIWAGNAPLCLLEDGTLYKLEEEKESPQLIDKNVRFAIYGGQSVHKVDGKICQKCYLDYYIVVKADNTVSIVEESNNRQLTKTKINIPRNKKTTQIASNENYVMFLQEDNTVYYGNPFDDKGPLQKYQHNSKIKQIACGIDIYLILLESGKVLAKGKMQVSSDETSSPTKQYNFNPNEPFVTKNAKWIGCQNHEAVVLMQDGTCKTWTTHWNSYSLYAIFVRPFINKKHRNKKIKKIILRGDRHRYFLLDDNTFRVGDHGYDGKYWWQEGKYHANKIELTKDVRQVEVIPSSRPSGGGKFDYYPVVLFSNGSINNICSTGAKQIVPSDNMIFVLYENDDVISHEVRELQILGRSRETFQIKLPKRNDFNLKHAAIRWGYHPPENNIGVLNRLLKSFK